MGFKEKEITELFKLIDKELLVSISIFRGYSVSS